MVGPDKGDGSLEATVDNANRLGVADRLTLVGGVPKAAVPDYLNRGDVYLNTASVDNTPVTVMEALACGLCVVSTDAGGLRHLLHRDEDALLVPPDSPVEMAAAVVRLLEDPELASCLSHAGRRNVEAFDRDPILQQWQTLLKETVLESEHRHSS